MIYVLIALIVLLLAETIGLWFVANKLLIPAERKSAALWVYQFSVVSFLFTVMVTPYMAAIIAHEDMNIYASVSIVEVILKLALVFTLRTIMGDNLQIYGILMCGSTVVSTAIYRINCGIKYHECKYKFYWNKGLFKEITGYTGWSSFQYIAGIFKWQAANVLLSQFFNQIIISARSISLSASSAIAAFSGNFNAALKPQIIKEYAKGNRENMFYLVFRGITGTWFLMYVFILPLMLEIQTVLSLWLKNVPEYTVLFVRLALLDELLYSIGHPINAIVQASGKIKPYEFVVGTLCFLNFPLTLMAFYMGAPPFFVYVIGIIMTLAAFVSKLLISRIIVPYSLKSLFKKAVLPIIGVTVLSSIFPVAVWEILNPGLLRLCAVALISIVSIGLCVYVLILNNNERKRIKNIITNKFTERYILKIRNVKCTKQ
jgi:O-antigen/teichoic acid export membrane protein